MPQSARIFRVFVSSTFSDMVVERNALQERVFPRLRELCLQHGARFQPIDLRWGISQEAGLSQRAVDLCLKEIKRCQEVTKRPNFLLLLGDNYGWCPLPDDIPADEFGALMEGIPLPDQTLVREWYWRDDNAVPAVYVLQPRQGAYVDQYRWNTVEALLRQLLLNALKGLDWPYEKRLKYEASVTEQEINAGIFNYSDAQQSAFCFIRTLDEPSVGSNQFADNNDERAKNQLANLKARVEQYIPNNAYSYRAQLTANGIAIDNLDQWCENIFVVLYEAILSEVSTFEAIGHLEVEREAHEKFGKERTRHFVGRVDALQAVTHYIEGSQPVSLVLSGQSGVGKSTVMARAIQQAKSLYPEAETLYRFIGITPDSSNIRTLLIGLCEDIAQQYGEDPRVPQDYDDLIQALPDYLALATPSHPLIIFLDALDQLQNTNSLSNLRWLPSRLPAPVRLVMSCIPGDYLDTLQRRLPDASFFEVQPLQRMSAEELLDNWLHDAGRRLDTIQRTEVLYKFSVSGLPLYLKLAFEEARRWHSYSRATPLQPDVLSLLRNNLFARLADPAEHGQMLVSRSLGYLAASRHGLSDDEILDVMAQDEEYWTAFLKSAFHSPPGRRLPIAVWSRLYFDLEPYLIESAIDGTLLLAFYHRQFSEAIATLFLLPAKKQRHAHLARYFEAQPIYNNGIANVRKLAEQAYQQAEARQVDELFATLTNFWFMQGKVDGVGVLALIDDYDLVPASELQSDYAKALSLIQSTLRLSLNILDLDKHQLANQLEGRLIAHRAQPQLAAFLDRLIYPPRTLHPLHTEFNNYFPTDGVLLKTIEGHTDEVVGALVLSDGRLLSWSDDHTLRLWSNEGQPLALLEGHIEEVNGAVELRDGRILSWSNDYRLRLWSSEGQPLAVLEGHSEKVDGALELSDGRLLSWSANAITLVGSLRMWSSEGQPLAVLEGHTKKVDGARELSDGRLLSWSHDSTLRLWSNEGQSLAVLAGHRENVWKVLVLTDGKFLSLSAGGGHDGSVYGAQTMRLWSIEGQPLATLEGYQGFAVRALELSDGRILSWSEDSALRLWSNEGSHLGLLQGHTMYPYGALELSDGRLLSWEARSGSEQPVLRLWTAEGKPLSILKGHTDVIEGALELQDKRLLSWSGDGTLRLWDGQGAILRILPGHYQKIVGVMQLLDGRLLSWSTDKTLRLWNIQEADYDLVETFPHKAGVTGVLALSNGRLISWAEDKTLRLWNVEGETLTVLDGDTGRFGGVLELFNGQLLSWAGGISYPSLYDQVFRLWSVDGRLLASPMRHTQKIYGVLELANGHILSWSEDGMLRLWSAAGKSLAVLEGRSEWGYPFHDAMELADGRLLLLASRDLELWSAKGKRLKVLKGHTAGVSGATELADGRLLSWSDGINDSTLRLWTSRGNPLAAVDFEELSGTYDYDGLVELSDNSLLVWSYENLWRLRMNEDVILEVVGDPDSEMLALLAKKGIAVFRHGSAMRGNFVFYRGRRLEWSGTSLGWWDWSSRSIGEIIFAGDAQITACTVLRDETVVLGDSAGRVIFLQSGDVSPSRQTSQNIKQGFEAAQSSKSAKRVMRNWWEFWKH